MKLIDNIQDAWRFASIRLAVLAGIIAAWAASDPAGFTALVDTLPAWARPLVGLAVFAAATLARVTKAGGQDAPQ
ncbi:MAG: hypothetical protein EBR45_01495 [Betaproteobacteria bacterium]|nr:hypothetical protein [Betaproteobacteria bacterium]